MGSIPQAKRCSNCGEEKPLSEFDCRPDSLDGYRAQCRPCRKSHAGYTKRNPVTRAAWNEQYRERRAELSAAWRAAHPDYYHEWCKRNPEKAKAGYQRYFARRRAAGGSFTDQEWEALCAWFGSVCLACGSDGPLTSDHVVPVSKGGNSDISNIQPLCGPCNSKKRMRTIDYRDPDMMTAFLASLMFVDET